MNQRSVSGQGATAGRAEALQVVNHGAPTWRWLSSGASTGAGHSNGSLWQVGGSQVGGVGCFPVLSPEWSGRSGGVADEL